MNEILRRTYWCHVDYDGQSWRQGLVPDTTSDAPGQAIEWMREAVRGVSPLLDRETFDAVWSWLGDHRSVNEAVIDLRRGKPYVFSVYDPAGHWRWTVYPVSVLPLAAECPGAAARLRLRQLAPLGSTGGPP